eukprot:1193649-Prorocentrum_minimum.AAC.3
MEVLLAAKPGVVPPDVASSAGDVLESYVRAVIATQKALPHCRRATAQDGNETEGTPSNAPETSQQPSDVQGKIQ